MIHFTTHFQLQMKRIQISCMVYSEIGLIQSKIEFDVKKKIYIYVNLTYEAL